MVCPIDIQSEPLKCKPNQDKVCAVVVTYNRKDLLKKCLIGLLKQTINLSSIIVIDNASTDGTESLVELLEENVVYIQLESNMGGAGGFYEGIKEAYKSECDWIWLLDDDTLPDAKALSELLSAYYLLPEQDKPILLASKVLWKDGTLHPMNIPWPRKGKKDQLVRLCTCNCLPIRSASFVSILIKRDAVAKYGLPCQQYFLWNDDVEYTGRILRNERGVIATNSVVSHMTKEKYTPLCSSGERFFFEIRNKIWMIKNSKAWSISEKVFFLAVLMYEILNYSIHGKSRLKKMLIVSRGVWVGVCTSP